MLIAMNFDFTPERQALAPTLYYQRPGNHVVQGLATFAEESNQESDEKGEGGEEFSEVASGGLPE
jgi:hypothetical protein